VLLDDPHRRLDARGLGGGPASVGLLRAAAVVALAAGHHHQIRVLVLEGHGDVIGLFGVLWLGGQVAEGGGRDAQAAPVLLEVQGGAEVVVLLALLVHRGFGLVHRIEPTRGDHHHDLGVFVASVGGVVAVGGGSARGILELVFVGEVAGLGDLAGLVVHHRQAQAHPAEEGGELGLGDVLVIHGDAGGGDLLGPGGLEGYEAAVVLEGGRELRGELFGADVASVEVAVETPEQVLDPGVGGIGLSCALEEGAGSEEGAGGEEALGQLEQLSGGAAQLDLPCVGGRGAGGALGELEQPGQLGGAGHALLGVGEQLAGAGGPAPVQEHLGGHGQGFHVVRVLLEEPLELQPRTIHEAQGQEGADLVQAPGLARGLDGRPALHEADEAPQVLRVPQVLHHAIEVAEPRGGSHSWGGLVRDGHGWNRMRERGRLYHQPGAGRREERGRVQRRRRRRPPFLRLDGGGPLPALLDEEGLGRVWSTGGGV
jgi:hypothetical protein